MPGLPRFEELSMAIEECYIQMEAGMPGCNKPSMPPFSSCQTSSTGSAQCNWEEPESHGERKGALALRHRTSEVRSMCLRCTPWMLP